MTSFIITGSADEVLEVFRGPRVEQHDHHCHGWRYYDFELRAKRAEAATREWAKQHIKAVNDAREAREQVWREAAE